MTDSATARSEATGTQRAVGRVAHQAPHGKELAGLSLAALGVVYGDIGTSPLYAMSECLSRTKTHAIAPGANGMYDPAQVLGVLSLFFWALMLVVVLKYLVFVLRADNKGEGGILALAALVEQTDRTPRRRLSVPVLLALFGAGLLYGDGIITPAISVLGAVEGLGEQSPAMADLIVPISVGILVGLFLVQRHGTGRIGGVFGWVMLVWFVAIAIAGMPYLLREPQILKSINPYYGVDFLVHHGSRGFFLLGSVVLVVTGGEALYADMGHFGKKPIRWAWYCV